MSKLTSIGFVVNPNAGRQKSQIWQREISETLDKTSIPYEIAETRDLKDVESVVGSFLGKYDAVFAVGGDGTAHHVAQGLAGQKTPFGLLPNGSGNDFSKMLGMPKGVKTGLELLIKACTIASYNAMQLYVTEADSETELTRWSINTAGFGFDAAVSRMKSRVPVLKGISLYLTSSFLTLFTYRSSLLASSRDGMTPFKGLMVAAGVGEYEGGGFRLFPGASLQRESFHVCEVRESSKVRALPLLLKAVSGDHVGSSKIEMSTSREVTFTSDKPIPVHADGEVITLRATKVRIALISDALKILVPTE